jgi:predicted NBD/HSP70 family sugar kinase
VSYGGIEAGGSKWQCALADDDGEILVSETFPTESPDKTIARASDFFLTHEIPRAVGVGCFGPLDLRPSSPTYGWITTTPKPGWAHTDVLGLLQASLRCAAWIDTDVNAAAIGEARRGQGRGLHTFAYITVGTGIGVGVFANGALLRGLSHPEAGHIRIPHDRARDPFPGSCPYHSDCFEGLASGVALRQRYGRAAEDLTDPAVWELEADYLALGLLAVIHILTPQRLIIGGGVTHHSDLLPNVRRRILELVNGYLEMPQLSDSAMIDEFIVMPTLGGNAGLIGSIELARIATERNQ